jgi:hypothetical protein
MKKQLWLVGLLAGVLGVAACGDDDAGAGDDDDVGGVDAGGGDDDDDGPDAGAEATRVDVSADIDSDITWTSDNYYVLTTHIFVRGATLTIEPGVRVLGENGSSLVITSTARLSAVGTAEAPIVFTSAQPEGSRLAGDWGGVVLLGTAPINVKGGTSQVEGFPAGTDGTEYGGDDDAHDCGELKYVRVEFAGFELAPDNELNALTLGACGTGTSIDFVQLHGGSDDGVEFFGGTADARHVIVSQVQDDGVDWDFGWQGRAQFVIVQQTGFSNSGFESDNNGNDNDATPRSHPTLYNVTLVGSDAEPGGANQKQTGMHLRRGTAGEINNAIIAHFADFPVDIDGASTVAQTPDNLFIRNSIFFDNGGQEQWADPEDNDEGFDEGGYFRDEATNHEVDPLLSAARSLDAPGFDPGTGSPALEAANAGAPPDDGFFDSAATFIGAVGADDWTAGWTAYPAN